MTKIQRQFALTLRHLRKSRGLSQLQLALRVGTNQRTISQYENATQVPKLDRIVELVQALGCSTDRLLSLSRED